MSKYYAIAVGRKPGIYKTWGETESLVKGYPNAKYKSFKTLSEAKQYIDNVSPNISTKNISTTNMSTTNISTNLVQNSETRSPLITNPPTKATNQITFYTDGSCIDQVGGYGFVLATNNPTTDLHFNGIVPYNPATNQIAELYAIYMCIYWSITQGYYDITIFTDSKYSIGCLTVWYKNWMRNGWANSKGETVANKDLIQSILSLYTHIKVTFNHVRAHKGDKYNEIADQLANEGRYK
jgi:ribonuclease HI